jgi:hypothetical protein
MEHLRCTMFRPRILGRWRLRRASVASSSPIRVPPPAAQSDPLFLPDVLSRYHGP